MDQRPLVVTVHNPISGETTTREVQPGDYVLIAHEPCFTYHRAVYPKAGTHVITVRGWKPADDREHARGRL
ncbi:hypothetical protein [Nonomuraea sp. NPDC049758]|uniref:hypothetical protein n=1 Tax=Nonomuraea sp. NPDC049758 TaxID=3154360 RepID=UPI003427CD51